MCTVRTLRLAILGSSPCQGCAANCCRQNGHAYAVLLEGDERRKFAPFAMDVAIQQDGFAVAERVLPYRDGRCVFLGPDDLCTVYDDRPMNCRRFECVRAYHNGGATIGRHGEFLQRNRDVLARLEAL